MATRPSTHTDTSPTPSACHRPASLRTSAVDGGNVAYFELVLGAEHFFGERLSVAGHVTLSVELGKSPERGMDSGSWGGSFHYYF